jgi:DNA-binding beta-propeller fold protein YncE
VSVISGRTNTVKATVRHVPTPVAVAVNPATNVIYVTNAFQNTVSVLAG